MSASVERAFIGASAPLADSPVSGCQRGKGPSTQSRSTSADSATRSDPDEVNVTSNSYQSQQAPSSHLPEYDYPTPLFVRNTFIGTPVLRPLSLDEFLPDRRIQSCPVEPWPDLAERPGIGGAAPTPLVRAVTGGAAALSVAAALAASAVRGWWAPHGVPDAAAGERRGVPGAAESQPRAQVLRLAEAIAEPELGSQEMPTVGSAGHWVGSCKPCAFFHTRGCQNGVQCTFCHLCDSNEKKRRQKEKIAQMRQLRHAA